MRAEPALVTLVGAVGCSQAAPLAVPEPGFAHGREIAPELASYEFSDPRAWIVSDEGGQPSLELAGQSDYAPPHRSPLSIALLRGFELGDFELELEACQTGREYGHRDLCLVFGFESPSRYYYAHLATAPDANAHNLFLVDGADRRPLLPVQARGVDWGTGAWHRLRLVRDVDDGRIEVWFDDLEQPVLAVQDATIPSGRIGFGSFDDTGRFAKVRLTAPDAREVESAPAFPPR